MVCSCFFSAAVITNHHENVAIPGDLVTICFYLMPILPSKIYQQKDLVTGLIHEALISIQLSIPTLHQLYRHSIAIIIAPVVLCHLRDRDLLRKQKNL